MRNHSLKDRRLRRLPSERGRVKQASGFGGHLYRNSCAAAAIPRLTADRAAVQLDDLPAQIQPNSRAAHACRAAGAVVLDPEKLLKDALAELRGDAGTRVRDGNLPHSAGVHPRVLPGQHLDGNSAGAWIGRLFAEPCRRSYIGNGHHHAPAPAPTPGSTAFVCPHSGRGLL